MKLSEEAKKLMSGLANYFEADEMEDQFFKEGFLDAWDAVWKYVNQIESDLEERTNQYHLAHAKISSRDAIIEQLSQEQLAKDVAQLESTIAEVTKLAKEPIVNIANDEHDDALLRLVRIIEVLEGEDNE